MDLFEEMEFKFYRIKKHIGESEIKIFLNTPFDDLEQYDTIYSKWIEKELLRSGDNVVSMLRRLGLRKKKYMAQFFLRCFYCEEQKRR